LRTVDFAVQARALEHAIGESPTLAAVATRVFDRLQATRHEFVLCHHDLHPCNVVWDRTGRPWIVDWEYAGLGDAAIDLASFASQHGLTAHARARLLRHYVAAGGVADAERLELATWAFDYVQWLWYRATLAAPGAAVADPALATARAKRLQSSLRVRARRVLRCNNASFVA
jgi:thiamine kinase-like enzyme